MFARRHAVGRADQLHGRGERRVEDHRRDLAGRRRDRDRGARDLGVVVLAELAERARDDRSRRAEDLRDDRHLVVVALLLARARARPRSAGRPRAMSRRASHAPRASAPGRRRSRACPPESARAQRPSRRARAHALRARSSRPRRPRPGAVGDQVERPQRAHEPGPQVALVVGVLGHAGSDERMRNLEQHGSAPTEERRDRRVADPPNRALRSEIPVAAGHPLA